MTASATVLRNARALVADGWTQGAFGNCCALQAISRSGGGDAEADALRATIFGGFDYIARWNDEPTRTKSDVLSAFDRTIADVEAAA